MTKLTSGAAYLTVSTFVFMFSGYAVNVWLGRQLGPELYGQYGVIIVLMGLINIMQTAGLPLAVSKAISEKDVSPDVVLRSALRLQFGATMAIAGIFALSAPLLAHLLKDASLLPYFVLTALVFPAYGIYATYLGYYNGLQNFKRQATINNIYSVAKILGVITLSHFFQIYGAIIGFILAPIMALLACRLPKKEASHFPIKKLLSFSIPITIFAVLSTSFLTIDLLFLKALLNSNELAGYYAAAQNISLILFFGMSAIGSVIFPSISHNVAKELHDRTSQLIKSSIRYALLLLLPVAALMMAASHQIIEIIYSQVYLPADAALPVLMIGYVLLAIFMILANILNGAGRPFESVKAASIGLVVVALGCFLLIPRYTLLGAAIAMTVGALVALSVAGFLVYFHFKVSFPFASTVKIILAASIIYFLAHFINASIFILPFLSIALIAVYALLLWFVKELNMKDFMLMRQVLPAWIPWLGRRE